MHWFLYIPEYIHIHFIITCLEINVPWLTQCKGILRYLGESVTVCSWSHHFPPCVEGQSEHSLWCFAQSKYLIPGDQARMQNFLPKGDKTSSEHCVLMYQLCGAFGWWSFTPQLHQGWEGIKGWMHRGRGFQFRDFRCRAYRAKLIPSRVLWWVPALGQLGVLHLITTEMCLVHWLGSIGILLWSKLCFYRILCLSDHQANGPS